MLTHVDRNLPLPFKVAYEHTIIVLMSKVLLYASIIGKGSSNWLWPTRALSCFLSFFDTSILCLQTKNIFIVCKYVVCLFDYFSCCFMVQHSGELSSIKPTSREEELLLNNVSNYYLILINCCTLHNSALSLLLESAMGQLPPPSKTS